jgi:hypothetical protein
MSSHRWSSPGSKALSQPPWRGCTMYMAIFLRVLPDSYREHFAQCKLQMAEDLAAVTDGLWEMRGDNAATVAAVGHSDSPRRQLPGRYERDGGSSGGRGRGNNNRGHGVGWGRGGTGPPHLGNTVGSPPLMVVTCMTGHTRGPACVFTITAMAASSWNHDTDNKIMSSRLCYYCMFT